MAALREILGAGFQLERVGTDAERQCGFAVDVEVAAELGLSVNSVLLAKSRVLKRLRAELQGLVD